MEENRQRWELLGGEIIERVVVHPLEVGAL